MPAATLNEAFRYFQQQPIRLDEFDQLYVNADPGRGARVFDQLKLKLNQFPEGSLKILFAGHRGCGKTTELIRLQKHIDSDFIVLNFSVLKELDILNIHYIELFIVTMEKLFSFVKTHGIAIPKEYIENIKLWVMSEEVQKVREKHFGADIETGIESGIDVLFLVKFFGRFKASAKASSSMKETLKTVIEPKLSELIWHCNRLITEIKNQLPDRNKKGLVIIIEDLDKIPPDKAEDIFYGHSAQLTRMNCHCISTFPISLLYHIRYRAISNNFDKPLVLPMIKVAERTGGESAEGIRVLEQVIGNRLAVSLFGDPDILKKMIRYSGGCLWDLFRMVRDAADNAVILGRDRISQDDLETAVLSLKADYERTIAENREKNIPVDAYYEALKLCATDPDKKPKNTDAVLDLMSNLTILNYNGKNWCDVHPLVRDILRERNLIPNESARNDSDYWVSIARIVSFFRHTPESGFLFCACNSQRLIQEINRQIAEQTAQHGLKVGTVYISFDDTDNILTLIRNGAQQSPNGVILNNLNELINRSNGRFISELNMGREILIDMNVPMLFWLSEENISRFANQGTDLFNRRDRSVVVFSDLSGVSKTMERLDEFYQLGFKGSESYTNLSLKIELMEKQFAEAKRKNISEERIAVEIAADLIQLFLDASLYVEAFQLFESYQGYYVNSNKIKLIDLFGRICFRKGEWDKALGYYRKSEQIKMEVGDRAGLAYTYIETGIIYRNKGEWDKALEYYRKSERINLEIGDRAGLGKTYNNIGFIYDRKGEWDKALEYYLKSEQFRIEVVDRKGLGYTYNQTGLIYSYKGEWDKALEYYWKSEQIRMEVGDRAGLGSTYNNIGFIYDRKGEWDKALEYYWKSEQIRMEVGDRAGLAFTYFNIGTTYLEKKEKQTADPYLIIGGYIAITQGMNHELSQMAWALNPLIEEMGMERFTEEGKRLCAERGIV